MLLKHQNHHQQQQQQPVPAQLRRPLSAGSGISSAPSGKTGTDAKIAAAVARCLTKQMPNDGRAADKRAADKAQQRAAIAEASAKGVPSGCYIHVFMCMSMVCEPPCLSGACIE